VGGASCHNFIALAYQTAGPPIASHFLDSLMIVTHDCHWALSLALRLSGYESPPIRTFTKTKIFVSASSLDR